MAHSVSADDMSEDRNKVYSRGMPGGLRFTREEDKSWAGPILARPTKLNKGALPPRT